MWSVALWVCWKSVQRMRVHLSHWNTIYGNFDRNLITDPSTKAFSSVLNTFALRTCCQYTKIVGENQDWMKYHGIKWRRKCDRKQLDRTQKRIKLLISLNSFSFEFRTGWNHHKRATYNEGFCSSCNYSTHAFPLSTPFIAICLVEKQKFNFDILLSFNRFPFVWQKWDFSFRFFSHRFLVYLFSIKSKSWCCDWLSFECGMGDVSRRSCAGSTKGLILLSSTCYFLWISLLRRYVCELRRVRGLLDVITAIKWLIWSA